MLSDAREQTCNNMTIWKLIHVPYAETHLARQLGAECTYNRIRAIILGVADCHWHCTATQYKSKPFRRWHDGKEKWRKVVIHVASGDTERSAAKANRCSWDPEARVWYVQITGEDTLNDWHRARLAPARKYALRVSYDERNAAKAAGARWNPESKTWMYTCHGPLPAWVQRHVAP
jgi:hypothetical protein